jgi:hypothetical protein
MQWTIIGLEHHNLWRAAMADVAVADVYYLPEYHDLYDFAGGRSLAYVASCAGEVLFYPFRLRPIGCVGSSRVSPQLHDIETVYGYTGPVATTDSDEFLAEAWQGFDAWCRENGVVAEFVRFHPLLRTARFAAPQTEVRFDRETATVKLEGDPDTLWQSYSPAHRNKVRKAMRFGLRCEEADLDRDLNAFVMLYEATMERRDASTFYHFPWAYYEQMRQTLGTSCKLFMVKHAGSIVAAALFLLAGDKVHYHLSGSRADAQRFAPNNLQLHHVALWAQRQGFRLLHLGGGRSSAPDDPLLVFKKGISRHTTPHHLGHRVHDPAQYDALCTLWLREHGAATLPSYFPAYRAGGDQRLRRDHAA